MQALYFVLAALHMVAIVVTGILWTAYDLGLKEKLRPHLRDIRAVHFGSLYLVPWFLGLAYAFDRLSIPPCIRSSFLLGWEPWFSSQELPISSPVRRDSTPSTTGRRVCR